MKHMKKMLLILLAAVALVASTSSTVAFLNERSNGRENVFTPATVDCEVMDVLHNNVQSDVHVKNTGDIPAYIRVALVINWQDANGNIAAVCPQQNVDYTLSINSTDWFLKDGFYYCRKSVDPGWLSAVLVEDIVPMGSNAPHGYTLTTQFLASAIQARPADAVENAWGVTVGEQGLEP